MKNEDLPANPVVTVVYPEHPSNGCREIEAYHGLTKLESFAKEAMGQLIHVADKRGWQYEYEQEAAEETIGKKAVLIAKATLAALEKYDHKGEVK